MWDGWGVCATRPGRLRGRADGTAVRGLSSRVSASSASRWARADSAGVNGSVGRDRRTGPRLEGILSVFRLSRAMVVVGWMTWAERSSAAASGSSSGLAAIRAVRLTALVWPSAWARAVRGLLSVLNNENAARFSFRLATPGSGAAAVLKLPELLSPAMADERGSSLSERSVPRSRRGSPQNSGSGSLRPGH